MRQGSDIIWWNRINLEYSACLQYKSCFSDLEHKIASVEACNTWHVYQAKLTQPTSTAIRNTKPPLYSVLHCTAYYSCITLSIAKYRQFWLSTRRTKKPRKRENAGCIISNEYFNVKFRHDFLGKIGNLLQNMKCVITTLTPWQENYSLHTLIICLFKLKSKY